MALVIANDTQVMNITRDNFNYRLQTIWLLESIGNSYHENSGGCKLGSCHSFHGRRSHWGFSLHPLTNEGYCLVTHFTWLSRSADTRPCVDWGWQHWRNPGKSLIVFLRLSLAAFLEEGKALQPLTHCQVRGAIGYYPTFKLSIKMKGLYKAIVPVVRQLEQSEHIGSCRREIQSVCCLTHALCWHWRAMSAIITAFSYCSYYDKDVCVSYLWY